MKIEKILVSREYYLKNENKKVMLIIGNPSKLQDSEDYSCLYQIVGIGQEQIKKVFGVDALQALTLTIKMSSADLNNSKEARQGQLRWLDDEEDYLGI